MRTNLIYARETASLSFLFLLIAHITLSQTKVPAIIPPTPNVASLAKYGDIPIGLYTGQPNISFPLYEIKYNDFSMPISLSYNYSGLKVEEYPGWVGTGWTLHATGVITRQKRGMADELRDGYNGEHKRGKEVVSFIEAGAHYDDPNFTNFLQQVKEGLSDTEPDMFVFTIPGLSGKFFFDETQCDTNEKEGNLFIKYGIPAPNQKITIKGYFDYYAKFSVIQGMIKKFEIIDEKGTRYIFEDQEKASAVESEIDNGDADLDAFANSWYLSRIITPFNNEVTFHYTYRVMDNPVTVSEQIIVPYDFHPRVDYHTSSTVEAILQKITFREGTVEFFENDESRLDWNSQNWFYSKKSAEVQPKSLARMRIDVHGQLLKQFNFNYSYFGLNARLRLDNFQEVGVGTSVPPTRFEYQGGLFPQIGDHHPLFNQDHWGYYTGGNLPTLLTPFFADQFSLFINGNLRLPVPSVAQSGILTKITYPAGGTTNFEYEPNDYHSLLPPDFVPPTGEFVTLDKAAAETRCNKSLNQCFEGTVEDRKTITIDKRTFGKMGYTLTASNCGEAEVSVQLVAKNSQKTWFQYLLHQNGAGEQTLTHASGPEAGEVFELQAGEYELVASASVESSCSVPLTSPAKASVWFEAYVVDDNSGGQGANYVAGGFRVSKVTDCQQTDSNGCVVKSYSYNDPENPTQSSGALVNEPSYNYPITVLKPNPATVITGDVDHTKLTDQFVAFDASILLASSLVPIAGSQGGVIGYKYVTVTYGENGEGGKATSQFTSSAEYGDAVFYDYPAPVRIDNDWERGHEVSKKTYKKSNGEMSLVQEHTSVVIPDHSFFKKIGLKVGPKKMTVENVLYNFTLADYFYKPYTLSAGKMFLTSDATKEISSLGTHTTLKNYFYENPNHLQLTRIETTNSNGDNLTTKMRYTEDVDLVSGLTDSEKQGISANPNKTAVIEKLQINNGKQVAQERNIYDGPKLVRSLDAVGSNPLEESFRINGYDFYGNILSHTDRKGETVSYVYDANQFYPITSVRNADPSEIFHTSFEDDGTEYLDAQNNKVSKTGARVLASGTYSFPASFQPVHPENLVMSYWRWSPNEGWRFSGELNYTPSIQSSATLLDEIRVYPKSSQMTSYTYLPGVGITTVTDPNNKVSTFKYDALGRLKNAKDQDGNLVKNYEYGYKLR